MPELGGQLPSLVAQPVHAVVTPLGQQGVDPFLDFLLVSAPLFRARGPWSRSSSSCRAIDEIHNPSGNSMSPGTGPGPRRATTSSPGSCTGLVRGWSTKSVPSTGPAARADRSTTTALGTRARRLRPVLPDDLGRVSVDEARVHALANRRRVPRFDGAAQDGSLGLAAEDDLVPGSLHHGGPHSQKPDHVTPYGQVSARISVRMVKVLSYGRRRPARSEVLGHVSVSHARRAGQVPVPA